MSKKSDQIPEILELTPAQISNMRYKLARHVTKHIEYANEVLTGTRVWSPTQARVFATLINKVVPDLSTSFHKHQHEHKVLTELSRDELLKIASGQLQQKPEPEVIEAEIIEIQPTPEEENVKPKVVDTFVPKPEPRPEPKPEWRRSTEPSGGSSPLLNK
jgi:hypothetical protein